MMRTSVHLRRIDAGVAQAQGGWAAGRPPGARSLLRRAAAAKSSRPRGRVLLRDCPLPDPCTVDRSPRLVRIGVRPPLPGGADGARQQITAVLEFLPRELGREPLAKKKSAGNRVSRG